VLKRRLFVLRDLPRSKVSVAGMLRGEEALSGTHSSALLIAEGLAKRGHQIGICVLNGQQIIDSSAQIFPTLEAAANWLGRDTAIWVNYGDDPTLDRLNAAGIKPIIWVHVSVSPTNRAWLESGRVRAIVTVSDTARMSMLRSTSRRRVGRVYNPLLPSFRSPDAPLHDRFERHLAVFTGAAGVTKGLHRLLEMWAYVRETDSSAKLVIVGTGRLYGEQRKLGPFGLASEEFERRYVTPLVNRFGSLAEAGIELAGLMGPRDLQQLYAGASVGVVNMNRGEYTETFCCAAVEMLATGLPVFSVACGALPETIGLTRGALLTTNAQAQRAAAEFNGLLSDSKRLRQLGAAGARAVSELYGWERIVEEWERLLDQDSNIDALSGVWRGPKSLRFWLEYGTGRLGMPWVLDLAATAVRRIRRAS
jgi:glycosyltransferase involved in cell wall biosynthesis